MTAKSPISPPLPGLPVPRTPPKEALGGLYLAPQGHPYTPLRKWPRPALSAELARIERHLAALADPRQRAETAAAVLGRDLAGAALRDPAAGYRIARTSLEKYRRRLLRALGRR